MNSLKTNLLRVGLEDIWTLMVTGLGLMELHGGILVGALEILAGLMAPELLD